MNAEVLERPIWREQLAPVLLDTGDGIYQSNAKMSFGFEQDAQGNVRGISSFALRAALCGFLFSGPAAGTVPSTAPPPPPLLDLHGSTSENLATVQRRRTISSVPAALMSIRKRALLNWDQLATLLTVTRRSLHLWASGGNVSPDNQAKLATLLENVDELDQGSPHELRRRLFDVYDLPAPSQVKPSRSPINRGAILETNPDTIDVPTKIVKRYNRQIVT